MIGKTSHKKTKKPTKRGKTEELEELEELEETVEDKLEDEDDENEVPRGRKRKKSKKKGFPVGGLILMLLLIGVVLAAGYFGMEYMEAYTSAKEEFESALQAAEAERDAAAALYAEADPESAANIAARQQVTDEMIAEANAEISDLQAQSEETDAAIKEAEKTIDELKDVEGYEYYRAIYDEYVEGRAYVEDLLSGD